MIALKQAVLDVSDQPLLNVNLIAGLADTINLMREETKRLTIPRGRTEAVNIKQLGTEVEICVKIIAAPPPESLAD